LSGILVVLVNAWMNAPRGIEPIDPVAALLGPAALSETLHMTIAAYAATGFLVAGVHAFYLRKDRANHFHRRALAIALAVGGVAAVLQPISGDYSARVVARSQPVKLAAMEGQFHTERRAPLRIGGLPDPAEERTRLALEIPGGLSFLAFHDFNATVKGLDEFPRADWPPVPVVHLAFQTMVGCGTILMLVALWAAIAAWRRRRLPDGPMFLAVVVLASPLGAIAIEAGWTVTEVGRQPWIVRDVMRTSSAVTPVPGLAFSLAGYTTLYVILGLIVVFMLRLQFRADPAAVEGLSK
jgi:cytochrome d ubiquinol oxidase subunit I